MTTTTGEPAAAAQPSARPTVPVPGSSPRRRLPRLGRATGAAVTVASLLVVLIVWEVFGREMNPIFASYPTAIFERFGEMIADGTLVGALLESLWPMFLGFCVAAVVGIPVGLLIGRYQWVEWAIGPYVTAGYATPLVALIPLLILWFGLGFTIKVVIVGLMAIFPIIISTWAGVRAVPKTMIELGKSFVASQPAILRKIIVPATVPHIMTGLRLAIGRSVIGIVVAEFFTALSGLGGLIIAAGQRFDTASLFVPVITLMVLGVGLTRLVGLLEKRVAPWQAGVSGARD